MAASNRCRRVGLHVLRAWAALWVLGMLEPSFAVYALPERQEEDVKLGGAPLDDRSVGNLVAMTRLLGYVRFFHPSDGVAGADWNSLAIEGARVAEAASDAADLAQRLEAWIKPVAPTVRVRAAVVDEIRNALAGDAAGELLDPALFRPDGENPVQVTHWRHRGINLKKIPGPYFSKREVKVVQPDDVMDPAFDPAQPMVLDLGSSVVAIVPRTLIGENDKSKLEDESQADVTLFDLTDRAVRFADVAITWTVMQHFYPYFDVIDTDWDAELSSALMAAATDEDENAFRLTLRRLIAALQDGHGGVGHERNANLFAPPVVVDFIEGEWVITHSEGDAAAQLKPGDIIQSVDGVPIAEHAAGVSATLSGATPQWLRHRTSRELLAGPMNSMMILEVENPENGARSTRVRRSAGAYTAREKRPEKVAELEPGVWYFDMDRATDDDFNQSIDDLSKAKSVIFDMRGYPRQLSMVVVQHLITERVTCAQWHIPIVTKPDRVDMDFAFSNWPVMPSQPRITGKVAFIIDGRAISYAETYMGIIEHYKLGELVGEATAGTNGNVSAFTIPGGYHIAFTGMKVLKHDGTQHHGIGILPTVKCDRTVQGVRDGRDELLEKAIEVVKRQ